MYVGDSEGYPIRVFLAGIPSARITVAWGMFPREIPHSRKYSTSLIGSGLYTSHGVRLESGPG